VEGIPGVHRARQRDGFGGRRHYRRRRSQAVPASLADAKARGIPVIAYGQLLNDLVSFLIVALAVFLLVKQVNRIKSAVDRPRPGEAPTTKECPFCVSTIPFKATKCANCTSPL
jgi:large conductance mechanosensitive channel